MKELNKIVELAQTDREFLKSLKNAAVRHQYYELSVELRELELSNFPAADKEHPDYIEAKRLSRAFKMIDVDCDLKTSYKAIVLTRELSKNKDSFDLDTASKILAESNKIFGE